MAIFRKNIPAFNKSHLHKFHLHSDNDLGYGLPGHDKVLQFDMLGVNIFKEYMHQFQSCHPWTSED